MIIRTSIKIKDTKNADSIKVFLYDDVELKYVVAKSVLTEDNYLYYDCITDLLEKKITQDNMKKEVKKDYYLIVSNNNLTLKYKINLNMFLTQITHTQGIKIDDIKDEILSNQDNKAMEEILSKQDNKATEKISEKES